MAANVSMETLTANILSNQWRENASETRSTDDAWLANARSALLAVPSAPSPESLNYLLNPLHKDASSLTVEWPRRITRSLPLRQSAIPNRYATCSSSIFWTSLFPVAPTFVATSWPPLNSSIVGIPRT